MTAPRTEQQDARSLADLIKLGRKRGYRNPEWWAKKVMAGRTEKARPKLLYKGKPV